MLDDLAKQHLGPVLTEAGFSKKGLVWNRRTGELTQVLDLQRRRRHTGGGVDFTLNVGLWCERVWCLCWDREPPAFVKEQDCFPRFRVGALLDSFAPRPLDRWWYVSDDNTMDVGHEVREIVEARCLPFLEDHVSFDQALQFAKQSVPIRFPLDRLYLATYQFLAGQCDESVAALTGLLGNEHWGERARAVRDRLAAAD
jgi:hypothetical protein